MTDEQKAAIPAKNAERKLRCRANRIDIKKSDDQVRDVEWHRKTRANISEEIKVDIKNKDTRARQRARSITFISLKI